MDGVRQLEISYLFQERVLSFLVLRLPSDLYLECLPAGYLKTWGAKWKQSFLGLFLHRDLEAQENPPHGGWHEPKAPESFPFMIWQRMGWRWGTRSDIDPFSRRKIC